jgi:hypothetical protein
LSADRINKGGLNVEYEFFASNYNNCMNSAMANDIKIQSKHKIYSIDLTNLSDQNDSKNDDWKKQYILQS